MQKRFETLSQAIDIKLQTKEEIAQVRQKEEAIRAK